MKQLRYSIEMVDHVERDAIQSFTPPRDPRVLNHVEYVDNEAVASAA